MTSSPPWVCPVKPRMRLPERASQTRETPSRPAVQSMGRSGCQRMAETPSGCATFCRRLSWLVSHTQRHPSRETVAARACVPPSEAAAGMNAHASMQELCSYHWASTFPLSTLISCTLPSLTPKIATDKLGWQSRQETAPSAPSISAGSPIWIVCVTVPVLGLQIRSVASSDPVTIDFPSPENPPQVTEAAWAAKICMHSPSGTFHIQQVESSEPASSTCPRWCQVSQLTASEGPSSVHASEPSTASQMATMPSSPAVARYSPSWLKASAFTVSRWPISSRCSVPVVQSHRNALSSPPPLATSLGSVGETARAYTGLVCARHCTMLSSSTSTAGAPSAAPSAPSASPSSSSSSSSLTAAIASPSSVS
mmetsp:Transcript_37073/g.92272  ORF Transcript_37073/g.92272 Transcript_37073/m.92272 type:complete len:367 (+) Transcript_37073:199-1299(+)